MLPLKLAWAWTIWKLQGQTFTGPVVLHLGNKEADHGLTYVAFSRAQVLSKVGIAEGIVMEERLCQKIRDHKKMKPRIRDEKRLDRLAIKTARRLGRDPKVLGLL
jgi:hypothetical protein